MTSRRLLSLYVRHCVHRNRAHWFKEENWNLEVTLQELRSQLSDTQSTARRFESDHKRPAKLLNATRESVDQYKNEDERILIRLSSTNSKPNTRPNSLRLAMLQVCSMINLIYSHLPSASGAKLLGMQASLNLTRF